MSTPGCTRPTKLENAKARQAGKAAPDFIRATECLCRVNMAKPCPPLIAQWRTSLRHVLPYDVVDIAQEHRIYEAAFFVGAALAAMNNYAQARARFRRLLPRWASQDQHQPTIESPSLPGLKACSMTVWRRLAVQHLLHWRILGHRV